MQPWSADMKGRIEEHTISSKLLADNPLGDTADRPLWVYLPPGYSPSRDYPCVYVLQGYGGFLDKWRNRIAHRPPFPELADAVFTDSDVPDALVIYVDAWTAYGGSQFIDSPGTGKYHSYLCHEVVPFVDSHYPTTGSRGIMGHSSGGFGALTTSMLRPDLFSALASHSGDALYEVLYPAEFAEATRDLQSYDGNIWRWLEAFRGRIAFTHPEDHRLLELLCLSACYSPAPDGTPELPFDPQTGILRQEQWQRWLAWDPIRTAREHASALRSLRGIWLDAGTRDEFHADTGARALRATLADAGVADDVVRFDLFNGGHAWVEYRYPLSLAWLCQRLSG